MCCVQSNKYVHIVCVCGTSCDDQVAEIGSQHEQEAQRTLSKELSFRRVDKQQKHPSGASESKQAEVTKPLLKDGGDGGYRRDSAIGTGSFFAVRLLQ